MNRSFRPGSFLATALCFLLPFVVISCPGGQTRTMSGLQLATGTTIEVAQTFGPPKTQRISPEPLALVALACAIAGIFVGLSISGGGRTASIVIAVVGGLSLLALQMKIAGDVRSQGGGLVSLQFSTGYWAGLLGFVISLILGLLPSVKPAAAAAPVAADAGAG